MPDKTIKRPHNFKANDETHIVEVFGRYWHDPKHCSHTAREKVRRAIFLQLGYKITIIWEDELADEAKILKKVIPGCD